VSWTCSLPGYLDISDPSREVERQTHRDVSISAMDWGFSRYKVDIALRLLLHDADKGGADVPILGSLGHRHVCRDPNVALVTSIPGIRLSESALTHTQGAFRICADAGLILVKPR